MTIQKMQQGPNFGMKGYVTGPTKELYSIADSLKTLAKSKNEFEASIASGFAGSGKMSLATGAADVVELRQPAEGPGRAGLFKGEKHLNWKSLKEAVAEALSSKKSESSVADVEKILSA